MRRLLGKRIARLHIVLSILLTLMLTSLYFPPVAAAEELKVVAGDGRTFYSYSSRIALTQTYSLNINGGTRPYSFNLSKTDIVTIQPSYPGAQVSFNVIPKAVGSTILTVKDTKGNSLVREIVVYDPRELPSAPLNISGLPDAGNPVAVGQGRSFSVSGGKPPYTVISANPSIARIEARSSYYMIWGVIAGSTQIIATDANGQKVQGTAYIGNTKPLLIAADSTLLPGGKGELIINSGNPPYTVTASPNLMTALKGTDAYGRVIYTLTAKTPGLATITVKDGSGQTATKTVNVQDTVTLSFPDLTGDLRTIDVGQTTKLIVSGGKAPYTVIADNPALVTIQPQSNGQYTVTGKLAGVVGIIAKDASGATRTLSLTVRALPTLTIAVPDTLLLGSTATLTLIGGAAPFTVSVSGSQLTLTKVDDKKYTLVAKAVGMATITVKDSKGTTLQKQITIMEPLKVYVSSNTLQLNATGTTAIRVFSIQGGAGPYTVSVSGSCLVLEQVNANQYRMLPKAKGTATITVKDNRGQTASQIITVQ